MVNHKKNILSLTLMLVIIFLPSIYAEAVKGGQTQASLSQSPNAAVGSSECFSSTCSELDEVWTSISMVVGGSGAGKIWDGSAWVEKKVVPAPVTSPTPTSVPSSGPSVVGEGQKFRFSNAEEYKAWAAKASTEELVEALPHGGTRTLTQYVVLHDGSSAEFRNVIYDWGIRSANGKPVSSNYFIDCDGKVNTIVPDGTVAWHAGCKSEDNDCYLPGVNSVSMGVDLRNCRNLRGTYTTPEQYGALNILINELAQKYGFVRDDEHIIGHFEVGSHDDPLVDFDWVKIGLTDHRKNGYCCRHAGSLGCDKFISKAGKVDWSCSAVTSSSIPILTSRPTGYNTEEVTQIIPVLRSGNPSSFSFVVLGDRYIRDDYDAPPPALEPLIDKIISLHPTFVINVGDQSCVNQCGDITPSQAQTRWKTQVYPSVQKLAQAGIGYYPVQGNHDLNQYDWAWGNYIKGLQVSGEVTDYSFTYGANKFIVFNDFTNPGSNLNWLNSEISSGSGMNLFAFAHFPLFDPSADRTRNPQKLCDTYGPALKGIKVFFTGHEHIFDSRIISNNGAYKDYNPSNCVGVQQVVVGSSGGSPEKHYQTNEKDVPHFLLVEVNGNQVSMSKWDLSGTQVFGQGVALS
jgi:hypothetical protein